MNKLGIIVAMEEEKEAIQELFENFEIKEIYDLRFYIGKIDEKKCILTQSGVGKVNAARTTQVLLDHFKVDMVINLGVAGAINNSLEVGDIVIAKEVVQHDFDITAFGHSKGYITGVGNSVICDRDIVNKLEKRIKEIPEKKYNVKLGIVATGDIFCTEIYMKDKIRSKFKADVVDMECGAIAQVCYLNNIPFIAIRSVSDTPDGENAKTFDENLKLSSSRCAEVFKYFLEQEN